MDSSTGRRRSFDISRSVGWLVAAASIAAVLACPAAAQLVDDTLEQQVEDQVESDVTDAVEDEVQSQVESDVTGAVEQQVQDQVESDVAGTVEQQVQDHVESDVAGTIEQQVQQGVASTVEQQIEAGVVDAVEQQVESGVTNAVQDDVASSVTRTIEQQLESLLDDRLDDDLDEAAAQVEELARELGIDDIAEAIERAAQAIEERGADTGAATDQDGESGSDESQAETYAAGVDALGRTVERDVWVVLVPTEHAARIQSWGFTIRERRDLGGLDRVLLRVDAPEDRDIAQAALELALDAPGTSVDFNHVYSAQAEQAGGAGGALETAGRVAPAAGRVQGAPLEIGMLDSAIATGHEALVRADVAQRDFVPFAGARPTAHGTAVASILVGESGGVLPGARVHAATVLFEDEAGHQIATTSSLVSALEWLVAGGVDVINVSLAGPRNRVLETAIDAAVGRGAVIVAAVGNEGPHGPALYPAAYAPVVGVTAVDDARRVYHYANRGRQVMFAAPGVDVTVAHSEGGFAKRSGTSMASPYAAAMIAKSLAARAAYAESAAVPEALRRLKAAAVDLGDPGFDETYGFGLIAAAD